MRGSTVFILPSLEGTYYPSSIVQGESNLESQAVSFVGRVSLFRSIHNERFHCTKKLA